jgi:hypothetical protein
MRGLSEFLCVEQIREIEAARSQRLQVSENRAQAMVKLLTRIIGVGIETADMLVHERCIGRERHACGNQFALVPLEDCIFWLVAPLR